VPESLPAYADLPVAADAPPGSAWGVFGRDDQIGTLNLLTPERRAAAAGLARRGATFNLDLPLDLPATPFFAHRAPPTHRLVGRRDGNSRDDYLDGFALQYSSQWDGLRHMRSPRHGFYNWTSDADVDDVVDGRLGIHHVAGHGIVGRGVLLDVARHLEARGDAPAPDARRELPTALLDEVARAEGVELRVGDVLLLRTGVGAMLHAEAAAGKRSAQPRTDYAGPGLEASGATLAWLWDRHVAAVASDNVAVEAWPPASASELELELEKAFLHFHAIPLLGLTFGELFDLEALAADCARDGVYEMLFVGKPLMLRGGVGSPANALAIK
jgi:kynurenine formamidase